jgi:protein TonB
MNSNSLLSSSLLDIIFENRNKDYGAYVLRKGYNARLSKSLFITLTVVALSISLAILLRNNDQPVLKTIPVITDPSITSIRPQEKNTNAENHNKPQKKPVKASDIKPLIVSENLPETQPSANDQIVTSAPGDDNLPPSENGGEINGSVELAMPENEAAPEVNKSTPVMFPDIPPEFPGGIKELIRFLKRNLNTPDELQEGEEVAVKIKFIVAYNGELMGFDIIQPGGEIFDNEVIRVLKKMPKWIPGKAKGENVSTYFILPVKFISSP